MAGVTPGIPGTPGKPRRKFEQHTPRYARRLYEKRVEEIQKANPGLTPGQVDELIFKESKQ